MTWTNGNDPGTTTAAKRRDWVRAKVGDVVSTNPLITDELIAANMAEAGGGASYSSLYLAASLSAESVASYFGAQKADSLTMGKTSVDYGKKQQEFLALAATLRKRANGSIGSVYVGGASVSENQLMAEDTNRVQPTAYQGQFSYPGTDPPLGTVEREGQ